MAAKVVAISKEDRLEPLSAPGFFTRFFDLFRGGKRSIARLRVEAKRRAETRALGGLYRITNLAVIALSEATEALTMARAAMAVRFELTSILTKPKNLSVEEIRAELLSANASLKAAQAVVDAAVKEIDSLRVGQLR